MKTTLILFIGFFTAACLLESIYNFHNRLAEEVTIEFHDEHNNIRYESIKPYATFQEHNLDKKSSIRNYHPENK